MSEREKKIEAARARLLEWAEGVLRLHDKGHGSDNHPLIRRAQDVVAALTTPADAERDFPTDAKLGGIWVAPDARAWRCIALPPDDDGNIERFAPDAERGDEVECAREGRCGVKDHRYRRLYECSGGCESSWPEEDLMVLPNGDLICGECWGCQDEEYPEDLPPFRDPTLAPLIDVAEAARDVCDHPDPTTHIGALHNALARLAALRAAREAD